MSEHSEKVLAFVNRVRTIQELDELTALVLHGTEPDDPGSCLLATAMHCQIGASEHPVWARTHRWVMRFPARALARLVGIVTEQDWNGDHREVALPDRLVDLAVADHAGLAFADELGFLRGWWVPVDPAGDTWRLHIMPGFRCPNEELMRGVYGRET